MIRHISKRENVNWMRKLRYRSIWHSAWLGKLGVKMNSRAWFVRKTWVKAGFWVVLGGRLINSTAFGVLRLWLIPLGFFHENIYVCKIGIYDNIVYASAYFLYDNIMYKSIIKSLSLRFLLHWKSKWSYNFLKFFLLFQNYCIQLSISEEKRDLQWFH